MSEKPSQQDRRWRRIAVGAVAALLFIALFGVYWSWLDTSTEVAWVPPPESQQTDVPLAVADIPAGKRIETSDIILTPLTDEEMRRRNYPLDYLLLNPRRIVGRTIRESQEAGEPFLINRFYPPMRSIGFLGGLKPGFRAVTITVSLDGELAGQVETGRFVDILYCENVSNKDVPGCLQTILEGVEVLAVSGGDTGDRNVTLAVTPEDAMSLRIIEDGGEFSLRLRKPDEERTKS